MPAETRYIPQDVTNLFFRSILNAVLTAITRGVRKADEACQVLAEALENPNEEELAAVNAEIVAAMRIELIAAVDDLMAHGSERYRSGSNRLPGGILKAVLDPDFIRYSAFGIEYGSTEILDRTARHYRRLNFGTVSRPGQSETFQLTFNGATLGPSFKLNPQGGLSADPLIPTGFFSTTRGDVSGSDVLPIQSGFRSTQNPFFPAHRGNIKFTKTIGIQGTNFLDSGLRALQDQLPKSYADYMQQKIEEAIEKAQNSVEDDT